MMLPLRLRRVAGHEGRLNDALFQPAARAAPLAQHTLVFFGGDVQVCISGQAAESTAVPTVTRAMSLV